MTDAADLAAIHQSSFTLPRPWSTLEISALLQSPHVFLHAEPGGFLIGRAVAGEAELLTVAVLPSSRRQGIGTRLVRQFMTESRRRAATEAFLEVAADNSGALGLYQAEGFVIVGHRSGYYTGPDGRQVDALVLSCAL
ncbi:GNAT family N-acetyltransferase [Pseudorhodobacter sp. MZDSW-24AT]|uniref:GNAT family N-acetyltransferase n=1 Tax=Pseudorhodobacter sp. MZDSW-24AT TaxID=2052957 RepID=UPI000C1F512A|nr:GNAT family N-acetyltransferase [Pseudorhodobacter sp. MZDSW-24AT]PJF07967.1 ribosomal-protein-alanine acetyltransferase [Pseudorhodobacter sp. MZDSW-24AT]